MSSVVGQSAWSWSDERQQFYLHNFFDFVPDLNLTNPTVREHLKARLREFGATFLKLMMIKIQLFLIRMFSIFGWITFISMANAFKTYSRHLKTILYPTGLWT